MPDKHIQKFSCVFFTTNSAYSPVFMHIRTCTLDAKDHGVFIFSTILFSYFWFKYNLGQKHYASQDRPDRGSNS